MSENLPFEMCELWGSFLFTLSKHHHDEWPSIASLPHSTTFDLRHHTSESNTEGLSFPSPGNR
ncbi:hypothetical protein BofuT4_P160800.1 [Botrytis cinerea T4]|uniref:Uncharacterized protein n=1 Tax=Botryotinia fuckeliana (strain T4) TaxID=999810 RepID=G2YTN1_BOTF4|nr:hypothetical protein BofuT4_P160800.1 [Botrytis cinerea T4]